MADSTETQTIVIECLAPPQVDHCHYAGPRWMLDFIQRNKDEIRQILSGKETTTEIKIDDV